MGRGRKAPWREYVHRERTTVLERDHQGDPRPPYAGQGCQRQPLYFYLARRFTRLLQNLHAGSLMSRFSGLVVISTAATAGRSRDAAVRQTAISSELRQGRQLRQGYSISCEESSVSGISRQNYIRHWRKTLPTLPALPFRININGKKTAGYWRSPARTAVNSHSGGASADPGHPHLGTTSLLATSALIWLHVPVDFAHFRGT